jgi:hypothetical protein
MRELIRKALNKFVAYVDKVAARARYKCVDCRMQTLGVEFYIVDDAVWLASGLGKDDGFLCIGCLEHRIGRQLMRADFLPCELNDDLSLPRSDRLQARLAVIQDPGNV